MNYSVGQVLGRYELLLPIAKGGMAQVWAARLRGSRGFQKIVAIKLIRLGTNDDERLERMFLEEATLAAEILHPNVVATLELGDHEGALYLVMEWVEGEPLSVIMKEAADRGGIPLPIAVNLIGQACRGLHAAHDLRDETGRPLGVVHRDVSPQNVLVTYGGTAKLVDFGVAKVSAREGELTREGELKGKFGYMAPEQVGGGHLDGRADLFALGIVLYYMTTGRHPFLGQNPGETLGKIVQSMPERPSAVVPGYPAKLEAVVLKALSKNPDDRWATASDMLVALEAAMPGCHDGSFTASVADYMTFLFGDRARERRSQLRVAQEMANRMLPESQRPSATGSISSIRAVSVDGGPAPSSGRLRSAYPSQTGSRSSVTGTLPSTRVSTAGSRQDPGVVSVRSRRSSFPRWIALGLGAAGAFGALSIAGRMYRGESLPTLRTLANSIPAAPSEVSPVPAASSITSAAPAPAPRDEPMEVVGDRKDEATTGHARKATGSPRTTAPSKTPAPRATVGPSVSAQPPSERSPVPDAANPFDRRF
jgi:serine/threonine-protein kinase